MKCIKGGKIEVETCPSRMKKYCTNVMLLKKSSYPI
jgi:hypothetical protein